MSNPDEFRTVCIDMLETSSKDVPLDSAEMKAIVSSVVEGSLAALATTRAEVIEVTMRAVARFASTRDGSNPSAVASVICDAASVIEISEDERQSYLNSVIEAALAACDHLLGTDRAELAEFLRSTLPVFLEKRAADGSNNTTQTKPGKS